MRDYRKVYPIKKLDKLQTNYLFAQYKYFYDNNNNDRDIFKYFLKIFNINNDQYDLLAGYLFNFTNNGYDIKIIDFLIEVSSKNKNDILLPAYCNYKEDWQDYNHGFSYEDYTDTLEYVDEDDCDFLSFYNYSKSFINYYQQNILLSTQIKGKYARRKKK